MSARSNSSGRGEMSLQAKDLLNRCFYGMQAVTKTPPDDVNAMRFSSNIREEVTDLNRGSPQKSEPYLIDSLQKSNILQ